MRNLLWVGALLVCTGQAYAAGPWTFVRIAQDFEAGVGFINNTVPAAIAQDGTVVFLGTTPPLPGDPTLFVGSGGPLTSIDLTTGGYTQVKSPQVNAAGAVVFIAARDAMPNPFRGVYRTTTTASPVTTVFEAFDFGIDPMNPAPKLSVALSESGLVSFSNIVDGFGALKRGPVAGPLVDLRTGSGTYFNTKELDMSDGGTVAVQMEYFDPVEGLARGILLFDTPGDTLMTINTAVEKLNVGVQPVPAMNNAGQVAFSLNSNVTITFFDPPDDGGGTIVATLNLTPGVYIATPTAFGLPSLLEKVVDNSGVFSSFGRVQLDDAGHILFEAGFDDGGGGTESGVFAGPNPVSDKVLQTGVNITINGDSYFFAVVRLGELNNADQFTLITSDFNTTDQQVWRVSGNLDSEASFLRGDANADGVVNLTDAIYILRHFLFRRSGGRTPQCFDSVDANDDGRMNIADPIRIIFSQFGVSSDGIPPPGPFCGTDPTPDELNCETFPPCE